ncbi:hypothetical protein [Agrobacterium sp. ST15.13.015]|uniref:hypothetical protein n=1 Tax=Agrobacterium sp. ST15.13.015 TaxID=3017319 RepID=UPI0022C239CA|nr:hypothetical protein [Agrobacterium sp. ST15.13.015]MCZ7500692.1 hypothetical protein [Rhizobium rhizogenes]
MADTPYPLPRQLRMSQILLGDGRLTYGPFDFQIFDAEDVSVFTRLATGGDWTLASVGVQKVSGHPFDHFTIEFPATISSLVQYVVVGERLPERTAGVRKGTQINPDAVEREFSKIASTLQELRRDANRAVLREFGGQGVILENGIPDGSSLYIEGNTLRAGPPAGAIGDYVAEAAAHAAAAQASEQNAQIYSQQSSVSAAQSQASAAQAQNLVDAAQAAYVGFQPGTFYDLGWLEDDLTLFGDDLGWLENL